MKKAAQDHQWTFEECQQKMGEDQQRNQVHTILNALKKAYTMLEQENVNEKIKKQIKLK